MPEGMPGDGAGAPVVDTRNEPIKKTTEQWRQDLTTRLGEYPFVGFDETEAAGPITAQEFEKLSAEWSLQSSRKLEEINAAMAAMIRENS